MVLSTLVADVPAQVQVWHPGPPPAYQLVTTLAPGVVIHRRRHPGHKRPALVVRPGWHQQARCFSTGADVFFGDEITEGRPIMRPKVLARARAICRGCPVAHTCLTYALQQDERYGVWAGASGRNRDAMQRRIEAGEPIQDVVERWLATL